MVMVHFGAYFLIAACVPCINSLETPLEVALYEFEITTRKGCDIQVLPDNIDWCNGTLNTFDRLPENTVCQSLAEEQTYLLCRNSRWSRRIQDRYKRSIKNAVEIQRNQTCALFCAVNDSNFFGKWVPYFTYCPNSVTAYPPRDSTIVMFNWTVPTALDHDGSITALDLIVGPGTNITSAEFRSSLSPGTRYVISYLATDNDNMNWTCSFTVTAEVPFCPLIIHIQNGNFSCTDTNNRGSHCNFSCNYGYALNGTITSSCQDNGNWSYGDNLPQCLQMNCNLSAINVSAQLEVVCDDNATLDVNTVCWFRCPNGTLLRNNEFEQSLTDALYIQEALLAKSKNETRTEADLAMDVAEEAFIASKKADADALAAGNISDTLWAELQSAVEELNELVKKSNKTYTDLEIAYENLNNTSNHSSPAMESLNSTVYTLTQQLDKLTMELMSITDFVNKTTLQYLVAHNTTINMEKAAIEAKNMFDTAEANASAKLDAAAIAEQLYLVFLSEMLATRSYITRSDRVIPTYLRCSGNGTWVFPGSPYCLDIDPPEIVCSVPIFTHYVNSSQISAVVTWPVPNVTDNSVNATVNLVSGPKPGDSLMVGQYIAIYEAEDNTGNKSPLCYIIINVEVQSCGDIAESTTDENFALVCSTFDLGTTCSLSCKNYYQLIGSGTVNCTFNSTTELFQWQFDNANCSVENCSFPPTPLHATLDCWETVDTSNMSGNSSSNATVGTTCIVICDQGYMLPYDVEKMYTCGVDRLWNPESFPTECIESGKKLFRVYTLFLQNNSGPCLNDTFQTANWTLTWTQELMSYPDCMLGYVCSAGNTSLQCDTVNGTTVEFPILVTCNEMDQVNVCDLMKDLMPSLRNSINGSVQQKRVLEKFNLELTENWLVENTNLSQACSSGSVLVGAFCVPCGVGMYYNLTTNMCISCRTGFYTNTTGRTDCTSCSDGQSTTSIGSSSASQCLDKCAAGSYSSTGLVPCVKCPTGTFQSKIGERTCSPCNIYKWTTISGSDDLSDCVDYDIYVENNITDLFLTNVGAQMSAVFWMKTYYSPMVSLELFNNGNVGDSLFQLEISDKPQLILGWDNTPLDVTMTLDAWNMIGVTWDSNSEVLDVYKDGKLVLNLTVSNLTLQGGINFVVISIDGNTLISGLSISNSTVNAVEMARLFNDCLATLEDSGFILSHIAATRLPALKYVGTTCKVVTNTSDKVEYCRINICQNGGTCFYANGTAEYTCNCTENYGGIFCEEILVHGNWSEWLNATECSVTCGNGSQMRYRLCNSPVPSTYGNQCEGNSTEIIECFLAKCKMCESIEDDGRSICNLQDEECVATCPRGYVFPPGQRHQTFQCGERTNYQWAPLSRLPICAESRKPTSYSATMTFTFVPPVPCSIVQNLTKLLENVTSSFRCQMEIASCSSSVRVESCATSSRKRQVIVSTLVLVLTVPLLNTDPFDLPAFYVSLNMTESIKEAVTAIGVLELTIQDIHENTSQLMVTVGDYNYSLQDVVVATDTNCNNGEVPVEGVCAQCQKGTFENNGWCVYCDRGSYQNKAGQRSCIACKTGYNTEHVGSRSVIECIALPSSVEPKETSNILVIIIVIAVLSCLIAICVMILVSRRFYLSAKDRQKFDLEADRMSLYTDFQDIAYNTYFRRKLVLGFDEDGYPIIGKKSKKVPNGDVHIKKDNILSDEHLNEEAGPIIIKQPFAYPEPDLEVPFQFDSSLVWPPEIDSPYEYPEEYTFDFPKIQHAVRCRVPGRTHFQNTYPLSQFGYKEKVKGRTRKLLPLPVNIQIPKKLPKLMYRPPESGDMEQLLLNQLGNTHKKERRKTEVGFIIDPKIHQLQLETDIDTPMLPPPKKKKKKKKKKKTVAKTNNAKSASRKSSMSTPSPRAKSAIPTLSHTPDSSEFPRPATTTPRSGGHSLSMQIRPGLLMEEGNRNKSPRVMSGMFPQSVLAGSRPTTAFVRSPRLQSTELEDNTPHPKPARKFVNLVFPPKPALKIPDENRPTTSMTSGRKSVTIREDVNITRPSTAAMLFLPSTMPSSRAPSSTSYERPSSDAKSARETIVAPYAARPKSGFSFLGTPLPPEVTEAYRPKVSVMRPVTPVDHPLPRMHSGVVVKRFSEYGMLQPTLNLPLSQPLMDCSDKMKMKFMAPPPFLNKVSPKPEPFQSTSSHVANEDDIFHNGKSRANGHMSFFTREELGKMIPLSREKNFDKDESAKKPSPPPTYNQTSNDTVIETSSVSSRTASIFSKQAG